MTLKEFIKEYLRVNGQVSFEQARRLRGCTYGGFTGRITDLRNAGWDIKYEQGDYALVSEPTDKDATPEETVIVRKDEIREMIAVVTIIKEALEDLL